MSLSPQEKLEALRRAGLMPEDDPNPLSSGGELKKAFLKNVEEAERWADPSSETYEELKRKVERLAEARIE